MMGAKIMWIEARLDYSVFDHNSLKRWYFVKNGEILLPKSVFKKIMREKKKNVIFKINISFILPSFQLHWQLFRTSSCDVPTCTRKRWTQYKSQNEVLQTGFFLNHVLLLLLLLFSFLIIDKVNVKKFAIVSIIYQFHSGEYCRTSNFHGTFLR